MSDGNKLILRLDRSPLYSPIGLRLIDVVTGNPPQARVRVVTGGPPRARVRAILDIFDEQARDWRPTDIRAVVSSSGIITYPNLGRVRQVTDVAAQTRKYRVRLSVERFHRVFLRRGELDGIEFQALPFAGSDPPEPPDDLRKRLRDVELLPGPDYPFEAGVPVLRGIVVASNGARTEPVADALLWRTEYVGDPVLVDPSDPNSVKQKAKRRELALSDARGSFGLPLRWTTIKPPSGQQQTDSVRIRAVDLRDPSRRGALDVTFPDALRKSQTIRLTP